MNYHQEFVVLPIKIRSKHGQSATSKSSSKSSTDDGLSRGDGSRFKFKKNSYACSTLIVMLFRFEYIGGLLEFSNGNPNLKINLIHYFTVSAFIFLPLLYMLLFIGHYSKLGCLVIGRIVPLIHGVGYTMMIISFIQAVTEMALACNALLYLQSVYTLPWMECKKDWGDDCIGLKEMEKCAVNHNLTTTKCFSHIEQFSAYKYREYELHLFVSKGKKKENRELFRFWNQIDGERVLYIFACCIILLIISDLTFSSCSKISLFAVIVYFTFIAVYTAIALIYLTKAEQIFSAFKPYSYSFDILINSDSWYEAILYFSKCINISNVCAVIIGSYMPSYANADLQAFVVWIILMMLYLFGEIMSSVIRSALSSKLGVKYDDLFFGAMDPMFVLFPQFFGSLGIGLLVTSCFFILIFFSCVYRIKLILAAGYQTMADGKPVIRIYRFYIKVISCFFLTIFAFPACIVYLFRGFIMYLRFLEDTLSLVSLLITAWGILYIYGTQTLCDDHHFAYGNKPAMFFKITLLLVPLVLLLHGAFYFLKWSQLYAEYTVVAIYAFISFPICLILQFGGLLYITTYYLKRQNMTHLMKCEDLWGDPNPTIRKERTIYHPRKETNYFRRREVCKHYCLRYSKVTALLVRDETLIQDAGYRKLEKNQKLFSNSEVGVLDVSPRVDGNVTYAE